MQNELLITYKLTEIVEDCMGREIVSYTVTNSKVHLHEIQLWYRYTFTANL